MTPAEWVKTIQLVESDGVENITGDGGRAFTSFQVHPDWLFGWARRLNVWPIKNERWESFVGRVVLAYATAHQDMDPLELAMYFHVGHLVGTISREWDVNYAARFERLKERI